MEIAYPFAYSNANPSIQESETGKPLVCFLEPMPQDNNQDSTDSRLEVSNIHQDETTDAMCIYST